MSQRWRWILVDGTSAQGQEGNGPFPFQLRTITRRKLSPRNTDDEPDAAVQWIQFTQWEPYTDPPESKDLSQAIPGVCLDTWEERARCYHHDTLPTENQDYLSQTIPILRAANRSKTRAACFANRQHVEEGIAKSGATIELPTTAIKSFFPPKFPDQAFKLSPAAFQNPFASKSTVQLSCAVSTNLYALSAN